MSNCENCTKDEKDNNKVFCATCGRIFIDRIEVMSEEDIKRKSHNRRTGIDVDQLDG